MRDACGVSGFWRMPECGTRGRYQAGCRGRLCRAADATYRAHVRWRHHTGRPLLGQVVSAAETRRLLRRFQAEGVSLRRVARALGLTQVRWPRRGVRLRHVLRLRWLARKWLEE